MPESDAAPSLAEANAAARAQLVSRLQRLWQSDPANYWKEFKASGLEAKDVWPDTLEYESSGKLEGVPRKQLGKPTKS